MANTISKDEALILALCSGSNEGYAALYDRYGDMLFGIILRIVVNHGDAENILQDTFVKIWKRVGTFDPSKARFTTWIINIARNSAIDFTRSKIYSQRKKNQNIDYLVRTDREPVVQPLDINTLDIKELAQKLDPGHRQLIDWMYFEGFTQQEISDNYGIPLGTVKTRTRAALMALRKHYQLEE